MVMLATAVLPAGPAVAAPTWTEVASGTTEDISAIEYRPRTGSG